MKTIKEWTAAYALAFGKDQVHALFMPGELNFINSMERQFQIGTKGRSRNPDSWADANRDRLNAAMLLCVALHDDGYCSHIRSAKQYIQLSEIRAQWVLEFGEKSLLPLISAEVR